MINYYKNCLKLKTENNKKTYEYMLSKIGEDTKNSDMTSPHVTKFVADIHSKVCNSIYDLINLQIKENITYFFFNTILFC